MNSLIFDILDGVHTVIAGVTGSGKSVLLNDIVYTIITNYSGNECEMILCDPKKTEFAKFRKLPHIRRYGDSERTILSALRYAVRIMDERNERASAHPWDDLETTPIYIIIDELADLLQADDRQMKREFTSVLSLLARKSRSANIHLIVATQQPARQNFPSFIQDNFTTKVALRCDTPIQSKQILGATGAENLTVGNAIIKTERKGYRKVSVPFVQKSELRQAVEACEEEIETIINTAVERADKPVQLPESVKQHSFRDTVKMLVWIPVLIVAKAFDLF